MRAAPSILSRATRRAQRGMSMLFALMALVILGLGAVALTRSVDTGTLIMGNLGFKQDTLAASSSGAEQAIAWLQANVAGSTLDSDIPASGYYASSLDDIDPAANRTSAAAPLPIINWDGACMGLDSTAYSACDVLPYKGTDVNGNQVYWVITRLCDSAGATGSSNLCARPASVSTSNASERGELLPGGRISTGVTSPYYRIIVRVVGPRNTATYTESLVHF